MDHCLTRKPGYLRRSVGALLLAWAAASSAWAASPAKLDIKSVLGQGFSAYERVRGLLHHGHDLITDLGRTTRENRLDRRLRVGCPLIGTTRQV